jgi:hypothetical protein
MKFFRKWLLRRRIKRAQSLILKIEDTLCAMNAPRWKRKQIWSDFIKRKDGREAMLNILDGAKQWRSKFAGNCKKCRTTN